MRMESTITGSVNAVLFSIAVIGSQQVYVLFYLYKEANLIPKCTYMTAHFPDLVQELQ
jgi:hypothetical protein